MQEYIYYTKEALDFPLHESIKIVSDATAFDAVVSNSAEVTSEVVAPQIDFYIKNTQDCIATKIQNIKKLYDVALLKYDNAKDLPYNQEVGNKVLIVGSDEEFVKTARLLQNDSFETYHIDASWIQSIDGHIGNLQVIIDNEGKKSSLKVDQIIWFDATQEGLKQSGTFDPNIEEIGQIVQKVSKNTKEYIYKKYLSYDKNICQYHERRHEVCAKCEEVCPSVAITKDDNNKHLIFSHIDCHGCGGCVSVCPSGALDYTPSSRDSLQEISLFYKDTHPLIIPQKMDLDFNIDLKEGVLPLMIDGEKFLHEGTLLTLLQQSSSQIIFYSDFLSKGVKDSINLLNAIYQKRYGCDAIIVAMDAMQLIEAVEKVKMVEDSYFEYKSNNEYKRAIFATRLQALVGDKDLGVVATGEHIHYGEVVVNESSCTLCLSCVGACNVGALSVDSANNSLEFNPSLCTACGYCELSCAEKDCLSLDRGHIALTPTWFEKKTLAKDELFACIECGKEFATKRAIEKVASVMEPFFGEDAMRKKTLYCCEGCKAKVMMQHYTQSQKMGVEV